MKIPLTILITGLLFLATIAPSQAAQQMPGPTPGVGGFGMPMDPMGMMSMMMGGGFGGPTGPRFGAGPMPAPPVPGPFPQQRRGYWGPPAQTPPSQPVQGPMEEEMVQMFTPMIQKADQELNELLLQDPLDLAKIQRKVRILDVLRTQQRLVKAEAEFKAKEKEGAAPQPPQQ